MERSLIRPNEMFALALAATVCSAVKASRLIQARTNRVAEILKGRRAACAKAVALAP